MKSVIKPGRVFAVLFALIILALAAAPIGLATQVGAQAAVAQSYKADTALQAGMIVKLADDKTKVTPVSQSQNKDIYGVVVRPNDAPLSLSEAEAGQQVYVATSGTYQVLVSDQNGPIKEGDYLVVSAIEGIGMKVNAVSEFVVGKALNDFSSASRVLSKTTVKDALGNERTVSIGSVQVDININRNPSHTGAQSNVPGFLQKAADVLANKPVAAVRVYLSAAVVIVAGIIACSISYAGIRTSVIALGRNPLARKTIFRNMFRIIMVALIILIAGLSTVYLILKL